MDTKHELSLKKAIKHGKPYNMEMSKKKLLGMLKIKLNRTNKMNLFRKPFYH